MRDEALRDLLAEHDKLELSLDGDGHFVATIANCTIATAATISDLVLALTDPGTPAAVIGAIRRERTHGRGRRWSPTGPVFKSDPDTDLYCVWVGSADNVSDVGTRQELLDLGVAPSRMARADKYGTSSRDFVMPEPYPVPFRDGGWGQKAFVVHNQQGPVNAGLLPREHLTAFLVATRAGDHTAAGALLEPFDD